MGGPQYVTNVPGLGSFPLVHAGRAAAIYVSPDDYAGVIRAVIDLQADIRKVTNTTAALTNDERRLRGDIVIIGTIGKSAMIDRLIRERKIDVTTITGRWESFLVAVVASPLPGVARALLVVGSDKRGTIYGIYDLSEQIGVSPWYWWADVPVHHKDALFVRAGAVTQGPPAVKYRGIFLNDEAPALSGWAHEKYGNLNHEFYEKVFELVLRLKGNYLWPAMWDNAFNEDDPLNRKLADEYGIVMGTSHHEPMLRAQQEWKRHGQGAWNYATNGDFLREFWTQGIERGKNYEGIITLGMRGDGDMPMVEGGDMKANIALLEKIVADQRKIIAEQMNPDLTAIPQDWALYKEVQDYYEQGMRVPDDVTLLWSDDNWGNLRRLPTDEERNRTGGAGIYYHFDYVGDPRSYKWLNTIPITKVWEQMNLAYRYGANRIWIVNVGDLKPMEFPIEFFLDLAWDPDSWPKEKIGEFGRMWAQREFGSAHAPEIAGIIARYTKYNGRRKPELLEPDTFSLANYQEAERAVADWKSARVEAEKIYELLPTDERDAFFELVLYPTKACEIVNDLYFAVGKNRLFAAQGRAATNDTAAEARKLFQDDAALSAYYNHTLAHGKWDHMMDQSHIGYTSWHDPPANVIPQVREVDLPLAAEMGVAIEGSASAWPGAVEAAALPEFDVFNQQRRYIEIFDKAQTPFAFTASASAPWIVLSARRGKIDKQDRIWVGVDWSNVPTGRTTGSVKISGAGRDVSVQVNAFRPASPARQSLSGFVEANGYISIEAAHYSRKVDEASARWEEIADYGRTLSSMTVFPVAAASVAPPRNSPRLEYDLCVFDRGSVDVQAILAPTLNFVPGRGLRFAISFDNGAPKVVDALAHNTTDDWSTSVKDSVRKVDSTFSIDAPGYHALKFWMVDPGVVLQKLVLDFGGVKPSYFGPPESYRGRVTPASN